MTMPNTAPMKFALAAAAFALLVLASASLAQRQKRAYVQIDSAADSELCTSASKAVETLRKDGGGLFGKFRDPRTRAASELQVAGLSFHPLQSKTFSTVDDAAVKRTLQVEFYHLDIDNDGSGEMITLVSGGHGAAGDGDTLYILKNDLLEAPQPVRNNEFINVALELGGRTHTFYAKELDFDPAYYLYPFAFEAKNYLLIEGNRATGRKHLVAALVAGAKLETRCYF
jgi:hypothetical protein